ncbi:cardiolipin synthase [Ligilactobacillus ceti]|uniref:Cardiolipin synthase n=1 Tax=Ligilactobacillus ceti DSM 22408 TaxID=1122146 RepID=A0A0R2KHZ1_9LACO|nr:cardiolipin synthase [Ligilactobacillus ceti]KRN88969.1 cardiolipin synthetase [Ligilactobacillus ceti DSM 22408]
MHLFSLIVLGIILFNTLAAIITIFKDSRDIAATWAWLLVLLMLPGVGFIFYLFVGKKISAEKIFDLKEQEHVGINQLVAVQKMQWQQKRLLPPADKLHEEARETVHLFLETDQAILTKDNEVAVFTDGKAKFAQLISDIKQAQHHVHLEYYSFFDDQIGNELLRVLEEISKKGVKVRIIYDNLGSRGMSRHFFDVLEANGGEAEPFFGSKKAIMHSLRLNYRDHRKMVIIDGQIGYIGGFNVGDQYLGRFKKFGYWRDTHLKIKGNAVIAMQSRFIMDWNATIKNSKIRDELDYQEQLFPLFQGDGKTNIQIVSSGPDSDTEAIKLGYLKLINTANDYLYIQTPYLIPDDSVMEALSIAALSGVKVKIMIPAIPDHPFVYRATQYYAKQLLDKGVEIYQYENGFLHAKMIVIDEQISSVGSANVDFRSFKLNFEANAFMYDQEIAHELSEIFHQDMLHSQKLTPQYFEKQSSWLKFKQYFSRLLSPIL